MKHSAPLLVILVFASCLSQNKGEVKTADPVIEQKLQILLDKREYFTLRSYLGKNGQRISDGKKQYARAFIEAAFNHYPESISAIDSLLAVKGSILNDSAKVDLMLLLRDNYFKTFRYDKAVAIGRELLSNYKKVLGDRSHDVENTLLIHTALAPIPPQRVDLGNAALHWRPDRLGLIEIPIRTGQTEFPVVFDTRAHISTV